MNIRWLVHHSNSGISSLKQPSVLPSNTFAHVHKFITLPRDANTLRHETAQDSLLVQLNLSSLKYV